MLPLKSMRKDMSHSTLTSLYMCDMYLMFSIKHVRHLHRLV